MQSFQNYLTYIETDNSENVPDTYYENGVVEYFCPSTV